MGIRQGGGGKSIPDPLVIEGLLSDIGFDQIDIVDDPPALRKKNSRVTLDLASIAKGFGVDEIGKLLSGEGIKSYIVEIGGEILAKGLRPDGKKWRVGINRPHKDAKQDEIIKVVHLKDQGFATSGNYRNFVEIDGKMYSHVLDPRSGYPIDNQVVSVSIVAPNCTLADGLATAVMVMGAAKGIELLDRLEGVEGLVITETAPGKYTEFSSRGFSALY